MDLVSRTLSAILDLFITNPMAVFFVTFTGVLIVLSQQIFKRNLRRAIETVRIVSHKLPLDIQYPSVKGFNTRTFRWAAASLKEDAPIQYLSLLIVSSNAINPSWYLLHPIITSEPFLLFEVDILPQTRGLYAILIEHRESRTFNQAYPHAGLYVSDAKSYSIYHQAYESCSGLVKGLYKVLSEIMSENGSANIPSWVFLCALLESKVIFRVKYTGIPLDTERVMMSLNAILNYFISFTPTDVQKNQISKKLLAAEREIANISAQKRSEEALANTKKLILDYNNRLNDPNISEQERRKITRKLDNIANQQKASLSKLFFGTNAIKSRPPKKSRAQIIYQ